MKKYMYIMVSNDKYELPIAVADSEDELSKITGYSVYSIRKSIYVHKKNKNIKSKIRFYKVNIGAENDDL